jgi:hypothetical protein
MCIWDCGNFYNLLIDDCAGMDEEGQENKDHYAILINVDEAIYCLLCEIDYLV